MNDLISSGGFEAKKDKKKELSSMYISKFEENCKGEKSYSGWRK